MVLVVSRVLSALLLLRWARMLVERLPLVLLSLSAIFSAYFLKRLAWRTNFSVLKLLLLILVLCGKVLPLFLSPTPRAVVCLLLILISVRMPRTTILILVVIFLVVPLLLTIVMRLLLIGFSGLWGLIRVLILLGRWGLYMVPSFVMLLIICGDCLIIAVVVILLIINLVERR